MKPDTGLATASPKQDPHTRTPRRVPILNAWVHDLTMDEVVTGLTEGVLLTLHVDMIMKLQTDRAFHDLLDRFDLVTCDSQIMYFALKLLGTPVRERVSGSDYFPRFYPTFPK